MRTFAALRSGSLIAFFALTLGAGCELVTEGRSDGRPEDGDASITSPAQACDLACVHGSHCELRGQVASCLPDPLLGLDAALHGDAALLADGASQMDAAPLDAAAPPVQPPVDCTPACGQGSHCVVSSVGASCEPDGVTPDASTPPPVCSLDCAASTHCELTVQGPVCVADPVVDAGVPTPCGAVTCNVGQQCCSASCGLCTASGAACPAVACVVDAGLPPVVDASLPPASCATTTCPTGLLCDESSGVVECVAPPSCTGVVCQPGTTCELVQVTCVRAPCLPIPQCVAITPVCNLVCKVGTHCEVAGGGSKCVSDGSGPGCGKTTCAPGLVCCSASCGVCAPKNGACPAVVCAPETTL